jgi:UDP-N-acetylmuramoyl-tripeptide--D-alanyl-D-alanine ligase
VNNYAISTEWFSQNSFGETVYGKKASFDRIETDSRNVDAESMFVAIKGSNVDGHDYIYKAIETGCPVVLCTKKWWNTAAKNNLGSSTVITVEDTISALGIAAEKWIAKFPGLVRLGITGSVGKSTTKEILFAIMNTFKKTVKNPGNLNSDIGLPASIFLVREDHEVAVFELGINYPGEMNLLAKIYKPDGALITNIGTSHIGMLGGTRESIASEKKAISAYFNGKQNLVIWEEDLFKDFLAKDIRGKVSFWGTPNQIKSIICNKDKGWIIHYGTSEIHFPLPGKHNLDNALAAIGIARLYGAGEENIAIGLTKTESLTGRSNIIYKKYTIVDDSYNASAESTAAALTLCDSLDVKGKRIYVLGSMKELGAESISEHKKTGKAAIQSGADVLIFYGEEMYDAYKQADEEAGEKAIYFFDDYNKMESMVNSIIDAGDLILVKASRSMKLERLTAFLGSTP